MEYLSYDSLSVPVLGQKYMTFYTNNGMYVICGDTLYEYNINNDSWSVVLTNSNLSSSYEWMKFGRSAYYSGGRLYFVGNYSGYVGLAIAWLDIGTNTYSGPYSVCQPNTQPIQQYVRSVESICEYADNLYLVTNKLVGGVFRQVVTLLDLNSIIQISQSQVTAVLTDSPVFNNGTIDALIKWRGTFYGVINDTLYELDINAGTQTAFFDDSTLQSMGSLWCKSDCIYYQRSGGNLDTDTCICRFDGTEAHMVARGIGSVLGGSLQHNDDLYVIGNTMTETGYANVFLKYKFDEEPLLRLGHMGNIVGIKGYDSGLLPFKHRNRLYWMRECQNGDANQSPLVIKHKGTLHYISK